MTYRGKIHDGAVVLDESIDLPEGSTVECILVPLDLRGLSQEQASPFDGLMDFAGSVSGTPADGARNHDAYINSRTGE